ncbi:MAG: type VI secretion system baseplate subunit TssG [Rhodospirillaceae bacterium]|nr:type VI secretion system baseplate subunit TssG [Rhodospirillaceae bacterium]
MPITPRDHLFETPWAFDFVPAVRLLEADGRATARDPRFQGRAPVGGDGDPAREAVHLRGTYSMAFPTAQVDGLGEPKVDPERKPEGRPPGPPEMTVNVLGLTGIMGAMPRHYTETLIADLRGRSYALRDFLDMINHRMLSLMVRGWEKYRLPQGYERHGAGGADPVSQFIYAIQGFGTAHLHGRLAPDAEGRATVADEALLYYSGLMSHAPKSAIGLQALLTDYFERAVRVVQFRGHWIDLDPSEQSRMPNTALPQGRYCRLGVDAVAGARVWDVQSGLRVVIGPLTYTQFIRFMPGGGDLKRLAHLIRLYLGPAVSCEAQVILRRDQVPDLALGGDVRPQLGWNTWACSEPPRKDVDDAVYLLDIL